MQNSEEFRLAFVVTTRRRRTSCGHEYRLQSFERVEIAATTSFQPDPRRCWLTSVAADKRPIFLAFIPLCNLVRCAHSFTAASAQAFAAERGVRPHDRHHCMLSDYGPEHIKSSQSRSMTRRLEFTILLAAFALATQPSSAQQKWKLSEEFRLGTADDGPSSFAYIVTSAVAKNGNIFVVDGKPLQIKLFSPRGQFLRNVGRVGGGPGEYSDISALNVDVQGNVVVVAPNSGRVIVFSPNGDFVRQSAVTFQRFPSRWEGALAADGSLLDPIDIRSRNGNTNVSRMALQRVSTSGVRKDTIGYPGCALRHTPTVQFVRIEKGNGSYFSTRVPFLPEPQTVFASDGTAWCAPGDLYAVYHFRVGGAETLHVARLNVPPPPLSAAEREGLLQTKARASNGNTLELPMVKPTINSIRLDDGNRLWVRRTATPDEAPNFDVFDQQGRLIATVQSNLRWLSIPIVVGDTAYGPVAGVDDLALFVRARIQRLR